MNFPPPLQDLIKTAAALTRLAADYEREGTPFGDAMARWCREERDELLGVPRVLLNRWKGGRAVMHRVGSAKSGESLRRFDPGPFRIAL